MDWRFDDSEDEEFDKGFQKFVTERNIKTYKKGDPPPTDQEPANQPPN